MKTTRLARSGERSALLNASLVGGVTPNTTYLDATARAGGLSATQLREVG